MNSCTLLCYDQSSCGKHAARTSRLWRPLHTSKLLYFSMIVERTEFWFDRNTFRLLKGLHWKRYDSTGYNYYNFQILQCGKDHIQEKMWFFFLYQVLGRNTNYHVYVHLQMTQSILLVTPFKRHFAAMTTACILYKHYDKLRWLLWLRT